MELTAKLNEGIQSMCRKHSLDHISTISDLLDYIIGFLNPSPAPDPRWRHGAEVNASLYALMTEYFTGMAEILEKTEWYDAWGDLFMEAVKGVASYRGQFFTPPSLSVLSARLCGPEGGKLTAETRFGTRQVVSDPTCGSSRMLLAGNTVIVKGTGVKPYLVGEDIDSLCIRMSAVNMAVHGCFGEAVCHDSLSDPGGLRFGYIINEGLYPMPDGLPTIRRSERPEDFFCCSLWNARKRSSEKAPEEPLTLWDFTSL